MLERVCCCALLIAGLTVSGVVISQENPRINKGEPLAYADGFDDGCHSGKKAGSSQFYQFQKDSRRFASDVYYSRGWSDGFRQCETAMESVLRETRMAMEQQRLLNQQHSHGSQQQRYLAREILSGVDTVSLQSSK